MEKVKAILIGVLILIPFIALDWYLYSHFPSDIVMIINVLLMTVGVVSAILSGNRYYYKNSYSSLKKEYSPIIENGLLQVNPTLFSEKFEKKKGQLYLLGIDTERKTVELVDVSYDKIVDLMLLKFTHGIQIQCLGLPHILVGDRQLVIFKCEELLYKKSKTENIYLKLSRSVLSIEKGASTKKMKLKQKLPIFVFEWEK